MAAFLVAFGILFLATLSAIASLQVFGTANHYLLRQLARIFIGLVAGFILFKMPLPWLKKAAPWLLLANLLVLASVFIAGNTFWGATRWLSIGGVTFQPSEFLKITAIVYLAALISSRYSETKKRGWVHLAKKGYDDIVRVFLPFLICLGIIAVILALQPDISTLGIISLTMLVVYFASSTSLWHSLLIVVGGVGSLLALVYFEPYRAQRLLTFLNPEADPLGKGFQLKQSLIAMGSGGWFGKGWGMSVQKFGFLPQAMTDSIFAILGEETGIIGCGILIAAFLLFLWLGFKIAHAATDRFSKLTAVGITTWITLQAFINIASTTGMFPLSGLPLPFFSYGGSHIIAELMGVGILLNISKNG